jgi:hypothetical protein
VTTLPLTERFAWGPITVEGVPPPAGEQFFNADIRTASAGYFEAMNIRLFRGRLFDDRDLRSVDRVVLVDEHLADRMWPGQDPIGRRLHFGDANAESPWETVIGVVGRVRHYGLDLDARIALYRPHTQSVARTMFVVVRSDGALSGMAAAVTAAVREVDADLPLSNVRSMTARHDQSLSRRRFATSLLVLLAMAGLVLPKAFARAHEVPCDSPDSCTEFLLTDCRNLEPCRACPPPPPDFCPCDHEQGGEPSPADQTPANQSPDSGNGPCPSQGHEHGHGHHHHQCVCTAANAWLISDGDSLSLHPPKRGPAVAVREHRFAPDSPVFLLDRPPMA